MLGSTKIVGFVPTRDAKRARAFFEGTLGLRFVSADPFATVFDAHGTMLRVANVPAFTPHPFTTLGWEVPEIEKAVLALQEKGVQFERYPWMGEAPLPVWTAPGGVAKIAWFKDPDGNILSLSQHA